MNTYTTLQIVKSPDLLDIRDESHDSRLLSLIESASRQIDGYCRRHFYLFHATRLFNGDGSDTLHVPDLVSIDLGGLATDDDCDRTFRTVWVPSDFVLHPVNADPHRGHDAARPYSAIVAEGASGSRRHFPYGPRTVRIAGEWGFWRRLTPARGGLSADLGDVRTDIVLSSRPDVQVGHSLAIGAEQVYVRSAIARTLSVVRGVNGTVPVAHSAGAPLSIFTYPGPVSEAAALLTAGMWRRSPPSHPGLAPEVSQLLAPYRRLRI